jgi:hypothetical protein
LIAGVGGSVVSTIVAILQGIRGTAIDQLAAIDPQVLQQLEQMGIDQDVFATFTGIGGGVMCCLGSLVIGAALGALGGAILAATKPE